MQTTSNWKGPIYSPMTPSAMIPYGSLGTNNKKQAPQIYLAATAPPIVQMLSSNGF